MVDNAEIFEGYLKPGNLYFIDNAFMLGFMNPQVCIEAILCWKFRKHLNIPRNSTNPFHQSIGKYPSPRQIFQYKRAVSRRQNHKELTFFKYDNIEKARNFYSSYFKAYNIDTNISIVSPGDIFLVTSKNMGEHEIMSYSKTSLEGVSSYRVEEIVNKLSKYIFYQILINKTVCWVSLYDACKHPILPEYVIPLFKKYFELER